MQTNMDEDAPDGEYAWEGTFERTWETIEEAADGSLRSTAQAHWRRGHKAVQGVARGMLRCMFIVLDCSSQTGEQDSDMQPSRLAVLQESAKIFITNFFDANPISTIALIITRDSKAELLSEPSSHARQHLEKLKSISRCSGEASLQNALELAREGLESHPNHTTRELLLLSVSLSSCDPGDVHLTLEALQKAKVRCHVFALLAEMYICRKLATSTGGEYGVAISPTHLQELLAPLVPPQPADAKAGVPSASLLKVGFPSSRGHGGLHTLCFTPSSGTKLEKADGRFTCPQCGARHSELPTLCAVCGLKLVSASELTKTYHHLFPLPTFTDTATAAAAADTELRVCASACCGCGETLPPVTEVATTGAGAPRTFGFRCPLCSQTFCSSCDELIHVTLHVCPGCELAQGKSRPS